MDGKISKKLSENILDKISMDFLRNQVLKNAYGNNDTVLIAVKADDDVIPAGSIVKVEGVTTGIKHSSVEVKYDSKLSNFDKHNEDNMIFALYNKNGYITYAVVVGKTAGSSESMVYQVQVSGER